MPPLAAPPCTPGAAVVARRGDGTGPTATAARLERGHLRVTLSDGVEVLRVAPWLRAEGDGRDPIDVLLRPCGTALTVTWRDGSRRRFDVAWLRAADADATPAPPLTGPSAATAAPDRAPTHPAGRARQTS